MAAAHEQIKVVTWPGRCSVTRSSSAASDTLVPSCMNSSNVHRCLRHRCRSSEDSPASGALYTTKVWAGGDVDQWRPRPSKRRGSLHERAHAHLAGRQLILDCDELLELLEAFTDRHFGLAVRRHVGAGARLARRVDARCDASCVDRADLARGRSVSEQRDARHPSARTSAKYHSGALNPMMLTLSCMANPSDNRDFANPRTCSEGRIRRRGARGTCRGVRNVQPRGRRQRRRRARRTQITRRQRAPARGTRPTCTAAR